MPWSRQASAIGTPSNRTASAKSFLSSTLLISRQGTVTSDGIVNHVPGLRCKGCLRFGPLRPHPVLPPSKRSPPADPVICTYGPTGG